MADTPDAYETLLEEYERAHNVSTATGVLNWDQQVMMPDAGTPARSKQLSTLSALHHDIITGDAVADALAELEGEALDEGQAANVREISREHERASAVPRDLVEQLSEASSDALPAWEDARENDDFEQFAPHLETLVELRREYAAAIDPDADPYEVLFADYEPYLDLAKAESVLEELRDRLVPLIAAVQESDADLATPFEGEYDPEAQEAVSRDLLDDLGYDWDRGRLDTSTHPFTSGNQFDTRITTRFQPEDPLDSIMSTVHEFGHAQYNLGLPRDAYGTPLGDSRDLTVHESQSRFWENNVGRTRAFWDRHADTLADRFDATLSPRDLYEAANQVYPDNLIRVEADELTYHMHIILRFELERDLISGDLAVEDVPEAWNAKMEEYLDVTPDSDSTGCLQDIHWSHGNFGYFPTYSLGSVLAAQIAHAMREDLDLDQRVRDGDFDAVRDWLDDHVYQYGQRYTTPDLVERATGEEYTAQYFLDYVEAKYSDLYQL